VKEKQRGKGRMGKREEIERDGCLVRRVVLTLYALPMGLTIRMKHVDGSKKAKEDEGIMSLVERANLKVVSELEMVLKRIMITIGYNGCGVDKEESAGVLFDHSQDDEYIQSSVPRSEDYMSIESPSASAVSSWGNSTILDRLQSSERALYKNYEDDRISGEDYRPPKGKISKRLEEVAMRLEGGNTMEDNGIGDSKHAVEVQCSEEKQITPKVSKPVRFRGQKESSIERIEDTRVAETQVTLPSTVSYEGSSINDILREAIGEIESGQCVAGIEMNTDMEECDEEVIKSTLSDHDRILRLERLVTEMRDENDDLMERIEDIVVDIKEGKCNGGTL